MSGRRAPELAAGAVGHVLQQHVDSSLQALVCLCGPLPDAGKSKVLGDWSAAMARTEAYLKLKFGHWEVAPYKLAIIGHHDERIAREGILACFAWYEEW